VNNEETRYVDKEFDTSRMRYSVSELEAAVPAAVLRGLKKRAAEEGRELTRVDFVLIYREPNGDVNLQAVERALSQLDRVQWLSTPDRISTEAELRRHLRFRKEKREIQADLMTTLQDAAMRSTQLMQSAQFSILESPRVENINEWKPALPPDEQALVDLRNVFAKKQAGQTDRPRISDEALNAAMAGDGFHVQNLATAAPALDLAAAAATAKTLAAPEAEYRPLPNFRALGIDRPAGPAVPEEMKALMGQTKPDGKPIDTDDVFSVGALLADNDVISSLQCFFPVVELERLGAMMDVRPVKSDENHSREVMSGRFTLVNPKIASDPGTQLTIDHPLRDKVDYSALTARALFPIEESDPDQIAAVEAARRGRLEKLSIAFGYGSVSCGLCGEMDIKKVIGDPNGSAVAVTIANTHRDLLCKNLEELGPIGATIRTPANVPGKYLYRTVRVTAVSMDGTVQITPTPVSALQEGSVLMLTMNNFFWFFGGMGYCKIHGLRGDYSADGRRVVGMFTNMRAFINTAIVDKGAITDAMLVLHPDRKY